MHPSLLHEIARYRQADLLREAERARFAHELSVGSDGRRRRRFRLWRRGEAAAFPRPAYGR
jgi:hypothetical protein